MLKEQWSIDDDQYLDSYGKDQSSAWIRAMYLSGFLYANFEVKLTALNALKMTHIFDLFVGSTFFRCFLSKRSSIGVTA